MIQRQLVASLASFGPVFAGNTAPDLDVILLWDSGGYVNLNNAVVCGRVRRWNPRTKLPMGEVITTADAEILDAPRGEVLFVWTYGDPLASVPTEPGWYIIQFSVTFPGGEVQESQRAIFEVLSSTS